MPPGIRFRKGQSGNPGGRPKKLKELEDAILAEFGEQISPLLKRLLLMAHKDKNVHAAVAFMDRVMGKAKIRTELTGPDEGPLEFKSVEADVRARLVEMEAALKKQQG